VSRADDKQAVNKSRSAALRAELERVELEEELVAAKAKKTSPDELREIKNKVRAARQAYRQQREEG
jgi:hypothetical protein